LVEAPGVEPGSRNVSRRASTGLVRYLKPRSAPTDRIRSTVASSISPQRPLARSSSASPVKWPSVRGPGHATGEGAPLLGSQCEVVVRSQNFCRCLRRPPDNLHLPHDVPSSGRNRFAPDRTPFSSREGDGCSPNLSVVVKTAREPVRDRGRSATIACGATPDRSRAWFPDPWSLCACRGSFCRDRPRLRL